MLKRLQSAGVVRCSSQETAIHLRQVTQDPPPNAFEDSLVALDITVNGVKLQAFDCLLRLPHQRGLKVGI